MSGFIKFETHPSNSKIGVLSLDTPGKNVNVLSFKAIEEMNQLLSDLKKNLSLKVLIIKSLKTDNFIAGADINDIAALSSEQTAFEACMKGHEIFLEFENLPQITIMAINGSCLGGGLEWSMAADYRLCSDSKKTILGLPEVRLGIIPGLGGTQRMSRMIGIPSTLDLILTGKNCYPKKALKLGLIDAVLPATDFEKQVLVFAQNMMEKPKPKKWIQTKKTLMDKTIESNFLTRKIFFEVAMRNVLKETRGNYPAPVSALKAIQEGFGLSIKSALEVEAQYFSKMVMTPVSSHLINIFKASEALKKESGVQDPQAKIHPISQVGVLGAGTMGGGIVQLFADKDYRIRLKDIQHHSINLGLKSAYDLFYKSVKKGFISKRDLEHKMALISSTLDYSGFKNLDFILEAIVEKLEIKKKTLQEVEQYVKEDTLIASNTSSLSITEMAKVLKRPENFVGMHFFYPVSKMPLVEVIAGEKTSSHTIATIVHLSKKLGKVPIVVKDCPGFLVNRLLMPYLNEAMHMIAEGYSVEEIDSIILKFGMPMGPCTLIDEVGVDVAVKAGQIMVQGFGDRIVPATILSKIEEKGHLGRKNQKGIYQYKKGQREGVHPHVQELLGKSSLKASYENTVSRLIYPMINEAALCLSENVVASSRDLDMAMIFGTGFPPFLGGLLRYADSIGAKTIIKTLKELESQFGKRFEPCEYLMRLEKEKASFYLQ